MDNMYHHFHIYLYNSARNFVYIHHILIFLCTTNMRVHILLTLLMLLFQQTVFIDITMYTVNSHLCVLPATYIEHQAKVQQKKEEKI